MPASKLQNLSMFGPVLFTKLSRINIKYKPINR